MITTNTETCTIDIQDLGVTLRVLLSVAAKGYVATPKRTWRIQYKGAIIGSVRIKDTREKASARIKQELGD